MTADIPVDLPSGRHTIRVYALGADYIDAALIDARGRRMFLPMDGLDSCLIDEALRRWIAEQKADAEAERARERE
jgi:hypothetical protein